MSNETRERDELDDVKHRMTRRQQRDHERYLRHRDERCVKQLAYYRDHREDILRKAKNRYLK